MKIRNPATHDTDNRQDHRSQLAGGIHYPGTGN
jgi:hypothetical protein